MDRSGQVGTKALPPLIDIFHQLDTDGSGLITHDEVDHVSLDILPPRVLDAVYVDTTRDVFDPWLSTVLVQTCSFAILLLLLEYGCGWMWHVEKSLECCG